MGRGARRADGDRRARRRHQYPYFVLAERNSARLVGRTAYRRGRTATPLSGAARRVQRRQFQRHFQRPAGIRICRPFPRKSWRAGRSHCGRRHRAQHHGECRQRQDNCRPETGPALAAGHLGPAHAAGHRPVSRGGIPGRSLSGRFQDRRLARSCRRAVVIAARRIHAFGSRGP